MADKNLFNVLNKKMVSITFSRNCRGNHPENIVRLPAIDVSLPILRTRKISSSVYLKGCAKFNLIGTSIFRLINFQ